MIALQRTDKIFSTIKGPLARVFNSDRKTRSAIDPVLARTAFDFDIEKRQSYDIDGRKIPGHFHIVRSDTNDIIPSAGLGKKFVPIQHYDIFDSVVKEIMPLANDVMAGTVPKLVLETAGTLHGGGTGLITVRVGEPFKVPSDSSECFVRLVFANPCNGRGSIIIGCTIVRENCQNQIPVACGGFSVHHTKNADIHLSKAMKCVVEQIKEAEKVKDTILKMATTPVSDRAGSSFIDMMLEKIYPYRHKKGTPGWTRQYNQRLEVVTQFMGADVAMSIQDNTVWKVYNAFTFPIFNPSSFGKTMDYADIFFSGMVGGKRYILKKIFSLMEESLPKSN